MSAKPAYRSDLAAEIYDLAYPPGHSFGDLEFYLERLDGCRGRILEPAAGSGRMMVPLLEAGLTVDGMDSSPEMLAMCRKNCSERGISSNLYEGGMQSFSLPGEYEAIIVPAGSFLLLEDRRESLAALQCFRHHLVSGGRLILDLEFRTDLKLDHTSIKTFTARDGSLVTLESRLVEVDLLNQFTVVFLRYEKWKDGILERTELNRFPLRWYGVEEFKLVLENEGFDLVSISSDYEYGEPPKNADQTITFEVRRD